MKVKLLRDARISHKTGEIVEVSPSEAFFLTSTRSAMEVAVNLPKKAEVADEAPKKVAERKTKKK